MYFAAFFKKEFINNKSNIFNYKWTKSWRFKQVEMSKIKWEWLYQVKHFKNYQTVEEL